MTNKKAGIHNGDAHYAGLRVNENRVLESIWIPATELGLNTSGTNATAGHVSDVPAITHSSGTDDEANFSVLVPEKLSSRGKIKITPYWSSSDTGGSSVYFDIDYRVTSLDSDVGAGSTTNVTTGSMTDSTTANALKAPASMEVPASDVQPGQLFHGLFYNDNSEAGISSDVDVYGLKVEFVDPVV